MQSRKRILLSTTMAPLIVFAGVAAGGAVIEVDRVDPIANVRGIRPVLESLLRDRERRDVMRRNLQTGRVTGGAEMIARILLGEIYAIPLNKLNVKKAALGGSFGSSIQMNSVTPMK